MTDDRSERRRAFPFAPDDGDTPLDGLRVVDAGQLIAGPFAATLLSDYGADVVNVEHPTGDSLRDLGAKVNGMSLTWKTIARNKKCVTLDLSKAEGATVFEDLVRDADVVIESFRPGTMEKWGVGYEDLKEVNPDLVMLRTTGFGQDGPASSRPGFGRIAGPFGGMTHMIGDPEDEPMSPSYAIEDVITGIFGALGILAAVYDRDAHGGGQEIDLSLYEAVFRTLDGIVIQYDQTGEAPKRTGNTRHDTVAPNATYETKDGRFVTIAASTQRIWVRLCRAMDREELVDEPAFESNRKRVENSEEVHGLVQDWVGQRTGAEVSRIFTENEVSFSFAHDAEDIYHNDHFESREDIVRVDDPELGEVAVQNAVPKFGESTTQIRNLGRDIGADNETVYGGELGYSEDRLSTLREKDVI